MADEVAAIVVLLEVMPEVPLKSGVVLIVVVVLLTTNSTGLVVRHQ